ncbi:unnamed protein product [Linum tenue]|uniref:Uncharacterized protein n=1 Tax=Linum tenue TaxID=586396 RepID=A0AAV0GT76_9ROSI|nr:unnamed protein product [Linum tenue]
MLSSKGDQSRKLVLPELKTLKPSGFLMDVELLLERSSLGGVEVMNLASEAELLMEFLLESSDLMKLEVKTGGIL